MDETKLYVAESSSSDNKRWWVFLINADGTLGAGSVFFKPTGQELKMIQVSQNCSNICFGGPDNKTPYITCEDKVCSLAMVVRGGEHSNRQQNNIHRRNR